MRKLQILIIATIFLPFVRLHSQNITSLTLRNSFTLNGKWNYIVDPYETGYYDYRHKPYDENPNPSGGFFLDQQQNSKSELLEYDFNKCPTLMVPGDWNSQNEKLLYYEGTIWYRRLFIFKKTDPANRVFIHFGAANYESDTYLNGKKLGKHIGGFTPFNYEITSLLKEDGENSIVVKVDNKRKYDGVPTLNTDWWNYGGITRDVIIVEVPATFITDYSIQLKKGSDTEIDGFVKLDGASKNQTVKVEIPELKSITEVTTDADGIGKFVIRVKKIDLWSPENPRLYNVSFSSGNDKVSEKIGFRSIETRGTDILLNGKPVFLRGICIHEENPLRGGRAYSKEDARLLLNWAKELNCNYARLAHYPHNEYMARMADEMGILLWEEIPVYWTILWDNKATYDNAQNQLSDLISRDKNRASVIIWSMANETPIGDARTTFLKKLAEHARSIDSTRLISAALEVHTSTENPLDKIVEDPFAEYVDLITFNEYIGWYDGLPDKCDKVNWVINYRKPVMISEFGADALQGLHGDTLTRWTEEYQEDLFRRTLLMLPKIPQFRGVTPWILCDFRSPRRVLPNIQDGWNRKGLIGQNGTKKKAFYVLKKFYDEMGVKYK
jgi:beta-glucuronidase